MTTSAESIRLEFKVATASYVDKGVLLEAFDAFEMGIAAVAQKINGGVQNADDFQFMFDLLHWDWCENPSRPSRRSNPRTPVVWGFFYNLQP
jgi:hypothetical protein